MDMTAVKSSIRETGGVGGKQLELDGRVTLRWARRNGFGVGGGIFWLTDSRLTGRYLDEVEKAGQGVVLFHQTGNPWQSRCGAIAIAIATGRHQ